MLGGNLGSLLYGDVSVMICLAEAHNRTEVGFEQPTFHSGVRHSPTEPPRSPHPKIKMCSELYIVTIIQLYMY